MVVALLYMDKAYQLELTITQTIDYGELPHVLSLFLTVHMHGMTWHIFLTLMGTQLLIKNVLQVPLNMKHTRESF